MAQTAADALQERLVSFAVTIIDLVAHLPKTTAGRHVGGQVRCARALHPLRTTQRREVRRAAQISFTNYESLLKSSMRPASGC
jgi:hypothetical protein